MIECDRSVTKQSLRKLAVDHSTFMNPLEVLNSKPTFNEFLSARLEEDCSYFCQLIQQNYMLGEVVIFSLEGGEEDERADFFHQLAEFCTNIRVVDGLELCSPQNLLALFLSEPLVYFPIETDDPSEVSVTMTVSDIAEVLCELCPFLTLAGVTLLPVYTTTADSMRMFPTLSAHIEDGEVIVSCTGMSDPVTGEIVVE